MQFKVGDKAVYPGRGVGVIQSIETKHIEGDEQVYYQLKILDNGLTIYVPVQNSSAIGMRDVISKEQVGKVYEVLKDRDVPADKQTWNRRYRAYTNKISTGDPIEVAKVLRDLALLRKNKNLSFGERKMYDHASSLLIQEISVAEDADEKKVRTKIEKIFKS